ncbi:hypothetical protein R1flu_023867 [Riccia fluitans]|uniref:Early-responsive to dehydration stress protein n=1 Tax=Riccia fluitans TaxID=41844 RepID=A0ABD1XTQ8_9MARC
MDISGLLTSAGINIALAFLFLLLYSIFSKQPNNAGVYFGRELLRQRRLNTLKDRTLESFIPSVGWMVRAWRYTEDEVLESSGLDSLVFLRIFNLSTKLFVICAVVGGLILAPLYYTTNHEDPSQIYYESFDRFTILNLVRGSKRYWVVFGSVYFISFCTYVLLFLEYRNITGKRLVHLHTARPQPDQFSVLVRAIPKPEEGKTYSDNVQEFFTQYHHETYISHQMVVSAGHIESMIQRFELLQDEIHWMKKLDPSKRKAKRAGLFGLYGPKMDPVEKLTNQLEDLHGKIRAAQHDVLHNSKEIPSAVVSFRNRRGATVAAQSQQAENPMTWVTEWAPEPRDVYWPNLSVSFSQLWFRHIVAGVLVFLFTLFYTIPNAAVQAVGNINNLRHWLPKFVVWVLDFPGVNMFVEGYLSTLLLSALLYFIPPLLLGLSQFEGPSSKSTQERNAAIKFFYFLAGPVFFIQVLSASLLDEIQFLKDPAQIPYRLAYDIPRQATFFMSYTMTSGWAGFPLEILQIGLLMLNMLKRHTMKFDSDHPELELYSLPYYRVIPQLLLFILVGLVYAVIAPLLPPFLLVYCALGYIVFKNQIMHVYEPAYETGGQYWPQVHNRILAALFLMQITFVGIFQSSMSNLVSLLSVPLPILTILYYQYCSHRFYPVFVNYSVESSTKKDVEDERKHMRGEIIRCVEKAYLHPALRPVELRGQQSYDNHNTEPLLSSMA